MPDAFGNPTPAEITGAITPFTSGPIGGSPIFNAAVEAFRANTLPTIQQQFQLQGLGGSPALGQAAGVALGANLVPLIQSDIANRLAAIGLMQGQQQFAAQQTGNYGGVPTLPAFSLAQQTNAQDRAQALQAATLAGNLILGTAAPLGQAAQLGQSRQNLALESFGAAGQAQRDISLQQVDAQMQDYLRRQGLAEAATTGIFGGSVIPPALSQSSTTRSTTRGGGK